MNLLWGHGEFWPLLLAIPLLWLLLFKQGVKRRERSRRYGAPSADRLQSPANRATVVTIAAGLLLLAYMNPLLGKEQMAVQRRGLDVIFCLDTSRSMLARDVEPDRFSRAARDIRSVLPELVGGDRVGLVAFAGQARRIIPLTHDLDSFRQLLATVDTNTVRFGGSDLAAAIRQAMELVEEGEQTTTVIVLLTDGEDLTGAGRQAAVEAAAAGNVLHTVGYGSTRGSKITLEVGGEESFLTSGNGEEVVSVLDVEGLRAMALATGGEFIRADVMPLPLVELKRKRLDPMVARVYEAGEETLLKTRYQWVLLPGILLLLWDILNSGGRRR